LTFFVCFSWNHGQACCAGSRIFVQAGIYDEFLKRLTAKASSVNVGDPFGEGIDQGPQVSQIQYDVGTFFLLFFSLLNPIFFFLKYRIMGYIESGKKEGATLHQGGDRHGNDGYFIKPTIFTNVKPEMKIVKEELFGPVGVVMM